MSKPLFVEDGDSEEELTFGKNEQFAKAYNQYRKTELLKQRKYQLNGFSYLYPH